MGVLVSARGTRRPRVGWPSLGGLGGARVNTSPHPRPASALRPVPQGGVGLESEAVRLTQTQPLVPSYVTRIGELLALP